MKTVRTRHEAGSKGDAVCDTAKPPQTVASWARAAGGRGRFRFRLYTADHTLNSAQAIANLTALCQKYLPGRHDIDVVDVLIHPQQALDADIRMTPTLVKLAPLPVQRIVGTLHQTTAVAAALGLVLPPP
jgi:circadian clock protein KaiB